MILSGHSWGLALPRIWACEGRGCAEVPSEPPKASRATP